MRPEKQLLIDEIKDKISTHGSNYIVTSYNALSAELANNFRREIGSKGGGFSVVKKRVLAKAVADMDLDWNPAEFEGHVALVHTGEDPVTTTKALYDFSKDNKDIFNVLGGVIDGKQCSSEQVEMLSKLPGKDAMRAQLLAIFEAPMSQTVAVMEALVSSIVYCLDNKINQSGS